MDLSVRDDVWLAGLERAVSRRVTAWARLRVTQRQDTASVPLGGLERGVRKTVEDSALGQGVSCSASVPIRRIVTDATVAVNAPSTGWAPPVPKHY